ncbi:MAG TPA: ABC transporter ATP-binding protein/permease [Steroidobacteraceae bacterium]|jgi:putative ATP-binding cassette transporter|nr:ABC transporter ATP-binding protein/permease [Steroidobacteraceae bacterium]
MTDPLEQPSTSASPELEEAAHSGLLSQLGLMRRALMSSRVGKGIVLLWLLIFIVVAGTTYGQIRLNAWNKPFYDALSRRDFMDFISQLGVFLIIAGSLLIFNVIQRWLAETLKYKMREGIVGDLIRDWMQPRRAFWLANAGPIGANPDQRMHEDARHLCELSSDLGVGLLQALILLAAFSGILWNLSRDFRIHIGERFYAIPGFMLWAAILYALIGSLLSYWVGHTLISRNEERYAREADLRFSLVRVNEHVDGISLAAGEADETRRVELHLKAVLAATARLVAGLTNLTWVTSGFGWVTLVAPTLVAAPLYFTGKLSFGGLMMAAAAFTQAQSQLRWFVDNFSTIADWRAALLRVATFRRALNATEMVRHVASTITYAQGPAGVLTIDNVEVVSETGCDRIRERQIEIRAGERLLIAGELGTNKTLLFRALAGLWPWGTGRVLRPTGETIYYFPRGTPYLPRGTLREILAYPTKVEAFAADGFQRALERMGLQRLEPSLDETRRWDRELSPDEQLALAFARVMLQAPAWLLIDGALSALDGDTLERVFDVFTRELRSTSIINIVSGSGLTRGPLFTRVVHLIKAPPGYVAGATP